MAVSLCGGLTACVFDKEEPEFSLKTGEALPSFRVTLIDGEEFDTADLPQSGIKNLLIVFFNTDCPDCRNELPKIQDFYNQIMSDETLRDSTRLICIAREENAPQIREYWSAHGLTLPVAPQSDRKVYNLFATTGIPRLYLAQPTPTAFTLTATSETLPPDLPTLLTP